MAVCKKCGAQLDESSKFCDKCGAKQEFEPETTQAPCASGAAGALQEANELKGNKKAVASLVISIIGLIAWLLPLVGLPVSIAGLIFGLKSLKSDKRKMAIIGIVYSIAGLCASIITIAKLVLWGRNVLFPYVEEEVTYLDAAEAPDPVITIIIVIVSLCIVAGILLGLTVFIRSDFTRSKIDALRIKIKQNKRLAVVIASVIVIAVLVPIAGRKTQYYTLDSFADYPRYSEVSFKETEYNNSWFLQDASDYKTVVKEFRQIFGNDDYYSDDHIKDGPGPYQAEFAFFKSDDGKKYTIILEVGNKIKSGDNVWKWRNIPISGFSDGSYVLKRRMWRWEKSAEEKYFDALKSFGGGWW